MRERGLSRSGRARYASVARAALVAASLFGAVAMVFAASHASATVMRELTLAELATEADIIVVGHVVESGVRMRQTDRGVEPWTVSRVHVREWVKGSGGTEVEIREIGGELQGQGMWIEGTPRYAARDLVVVFLRRIEDGAAFRTVGMAQGRFEVVRGAPGVPSTVRRDLDGVAFAAWRDGEMVVTDAHDSAVELGSFLARVRGLAGGAQ